MAGVTVNPNFICLKIPSKGKDGNARKFDLVNSTGGRIIFKIKGRHADKFQSISPSMGFTENNCLSEIWFQPKVITSAVGFYKNDKFTLIWASTGCDPNAMEAKDVWKQGNPNEPKQLNTINIDLWVTDENNETINK